MNLTKIVVIFLAICRYKPHCLLQFVNFFLGKMTKFPRPQILPQAQRPHGQAFEIHHRCAAEGQHPLGLMELSLPQGQQPLPLPSDLQLRRQAAQAVCQGDPLRQPGRVRLRRGALCASVVDFIHMAFRRE